MVSENVFMTQLTGIGIPGPQVSRIVDVLRRTKCDVSELIDPSKGKTTVQGKLLASSSVHIICFGSRIAVQQSSASLSPSPSALLTAEALKRHDVGSKYVIKMCTMALSENVVIECFPRAANTVVVAVCVRVRKFWHRRYPKPVYLQSRNWIAHATRTTWGMGVSFLLFC